MQDDNLDPVRISGETPAIVWRSLNVVYRAETTSTNDEALHLARNGAPEGTLVIAETQTAGRGRKGRRWISPAGSGLYFSLIMRPSQPAQRWILLTHLAGSALADTIAELSKEGLAANVLDVNLKWPNDVLLSDKKVAGILVETASTSGMLQAAVIGVGINVKPTAFPPELAGKAACVSEAAGADISRSHLLVRYLYHFQVGYDFFARGDAQAILENWKKRSRMWNNTPVWVIENEETRPAVTCGLDENGALLVRMESGAVETILAGDISIRRLERN